MKDNLWIHCNATGDPKPKICWGRYDRVGDKLDRRRFIPYFNGTLHIKRVRLEDQGEYFCLAANRGAMKVTKFSLVVKGKLTSFIIMHVPVGSLNFGLAFFYNIL